MNQVEVIGQELSHHESKIMTEKGIQIEVTIRGHFGEQVRRSSPRSLILVDFRIKFEQPSFSDGVGEDLRLINL